MSQTLLTDDETVRHDLGCNPAQGYFIGRPMAAQRLPAWAADWRARLGGLLGP